MFGVKDSIRRLRIHLLHITATVIGRKMMESDRACIIAPHPDDETLGCGGLLRRLCDRGKAPHVIILSGGGKSHAGCCAVDENVLKSARRSLAQSVLASLGLPASHLHMLDFPDGSISPACPEMKVLQSLMRSISPQQVFIPHHGEGWPDHLVVRELAERLSLPDSVEIYQYCVWSWYYNVWKMGWKTARLLYLDKIEQESKRKAVQSYIITNGGGITCGKPWSGVLPRILAEAAMWDKELYFKLT